MNISNDQEPDEITVLDEVPASQRRWVLQALRDETTGGLLLMAVTVIALIWANSPWSHSYEHIANLPFGTPQFSLPLNIWAADFLLAIFFFVAGVELKHEFVSGTLSSPRKAAVPMAAALGGMVTSAVIFLAINHSSGHQSAWGIPISTDIAFALAILAIAGRKLPIELRSFLLTLAVVNDLGAITVIAIFYSHGFHAKYFAIALVLIAIFATLQSRGFRHVAFYIPLALGTWYAMYESGIHATVAGVAMGLAMRVTPRGSEKLSPGDQAEHAIRPISSGLCVPIFALLSAGVSLQGFSISAGLTHPLTLGVLCGLVIGQPLGVTLAAYVTTKLTGGSLNEELTWWDVLVVGSLASIGFTVALLVSEVSFADDPATLAISKFAIVLTNVVAMSVAITAISLRSRFIGRYR